MKLTHSFVAVNLMNDLFENNFISCKTCIIGHINKIIGNYYVT